MQAQAFSCFDHLHSPQTTLNCISITQKMSYRLPSTLLFKPSTFKLSLPSHSSITPFNKLFSTAKTLSSKQSHPSTFTSSTNYFIKRPLDFKNSNRFQSRCFSNQSSALVSSGSKIFQQKNYKQLFITSASVIGSVSFILMSLFNTYHNFSHLLIQTFVLVSIIVGLD